MVCAIQQFSLRGLKSSCYVLVSPMRDPVVTAIVAKTQEAVAAQDTHQLISNIKDLFDMLKTMKLVSLVGLFWLHDSVADCAPGCSQLSDSVPSTLSTGRKCSL